MSINELQGKVQELRELRRMAAELQAEIDAVQDTIKAHMTQQGVDSIQGSDFIVTWHEVKTSRFDKEAMVSTFGLECYERFCRTTITRRFTVK